VSHLPQRKANDCLNCGVTVVGKYCHNCGQENVEPKESVWHLLSHFFNDITHFDGKFFSTLKILLFKPGFLSKEYMNGRRAGYLNPVRMYFFTSFIFFLIFFSAFHFDKFNSKDVDFTFNGKTENTINAISESDFKDFTAKLNNGHPMSRAEFKTYIDSIKNKSVVRIFGNAQTKHYTSKAQYDSALLTGNIKDGWIRRYINFKEIDINEKYKNQQGKFVTDFINSLMHHFPQMLFVSLPFAALFLKLLYIRREQFYYVSHAIFTIHFYIFVFITMLITILITKMQGWLNWQWLGFVNGLLALLIFFYLYKAMRNFYQQRRAKTILKYFLFSFSFFFLIIFLFTVFGFVSIFQV
jgi:Protein of unknown function (DUF3667)